MVVAAQRGDLDAFGRLIGRFQDMAYALAYVRLGDSDLAEDAAQEAFIESFLHLGSLAEPAAFPGWLKRIVLRQCNRLTRRRRVATESLEPALEMASDEPGPEERIEADEINRLLHLAIDSLPEHERITTLLFYLSSYSQQEIAEFLEVPTTTVRKRLQYARKRLKEKLEVMVDDYQAHKPSRDTEFNRRVRMFIGIRTGDVANVGRLLREDPGLVDAQEALSETLSYLYPRAKPRTGPYPSGADRARSGWPPIQWAVWMGDVEMVRLLLDNGTPVETTTGHGEPMLNIAASHGHIETARLLLERGADPNGGHYPHAPTHKAAGTNQIEMQRLLLEWNADIERRDRHGRTPLHWAATAGHAGMVRLLIERNAEVEATDNRGRTARWWAEHGGHIDTVATIDTQSNQDSGRNR
jgi:RNA polymerase sigma factor (sigma-70 family)